MSRRRGISAAALGLLFILLMFFGLFIPLLNIQTTLLGTIFEVNYWLFELENLVCLIASIIAIIGAFLTFGAKEYAISEGLTIFGASVALTASFLYMLPRIGASTNLSVLQVPYASFWYFYQGQLQYTVLFNNIPVYLASLQIPLGPIITCLSAFLAVIIYLALLGGYWRRG
ncbi:MAG: hypothetical protein ACETWM_08570 [Candidatus Lokiarchaeia archaeon]